MGQLPIPFLRNTHTHTHTHKGEGKMFYHKGIPQLHSKATVTFKGGWDKLYYTQHILLSNVGQLPFFFEKQTRTHTKKRERGSNTKAHYNSTQKP